MMKIILRVFISSLLLLPIPALADWDLTRIIEILSQINGDKLTAIKGTGEKTITELQSLQGLLKGSHDYGAKDYTDFQSLGKGAEQWQSALDVYKSGTGNLGQVARQLQNDFPINPDIKNINPKEVQNKYLLLQAKTALASRAASQLAFDKVQQQISYHQKNLQTKIDTTQDLKSAVDLQNRLIFENNMIQLEVLRLMALTNQQKAIETQADVNHATINKTFSSKLH